MEGERKRVHKATAGMSVAQKLERKRASSRKSNLCRVRLGEHLKRWNRMKDQHGISTDIDMAKILLDSFEGEAAAVQRQGAPSHSTLVHPQVAQTVQEDRDYGSDVSDVSTLTCPSPTEAPCSPASFPSSSKEPVNDEEADSPSIVTVVDV